MESIKKIVAKKIKAARKAKNWTQTDLAIESGVSFRGIQNIESGLRAPREETLNAIVGALGISVSDLYITSAAPLKIAPDISPPPSLDQIREVNKATLLEAINESRKNQYSHLSAPKQELIEMIGKLTDRQVLTITKVVSDVIGHKKQLGLKKIR